MSTYFKNAWVKLREWNYSSKCTLIWAWSIEILLKPNFYSLVIKRKNILKQECSKMYEYSMIYKNQWAKGNIQYCWWFVMYKYNDLIAIKTLRKILFWLTFSYFKVLRIPLHFTQVLCFIYIKKTRIQLYCKSIQTVQVQ